MAVSEAETFETIGLAVSWAYLGLMFANGSLNTIFYELDYSALMDAIEGPQLISFLGGVDVRLPPSLNLLLSEIKAAASVEPQALLNTE